MTVAISVARRGALFSGLGGAALLALAPGASSQTCPPAPGSALTAHLAEVNSYRASNGVAPLVLNDKLTAAAQGHATDMARQNYFSHTSLDGRTPAQRISAAGYLGWTVWGENIAWGYRDWHSALLVWQASTGHRANLLNPKFKEIGLGAAVSSSGRPYWVQDFGARLVPTAPTAAPRGTGGIGRAAAGAAQ